MEKANWIAFMICIAATVIGLIMVVLQKKEIIRPLTTQTITNIRFVSGGTITLVATMCGVLMIGDYSGLFAGLYVFVVAVIYIVIQVIFRK